MRKPIQIGDKRFNSKKDALLFYKIILNSYEFNAELNDVDFKYTLALLQTHPRVKEKIGVGVKSIRVVKIEKYRTKSFELIRLDNSTEKFSYIRRINSPPSNFTKFSAACRLVIEEDIRNVKLAYFKKHSKKGRVKCQETGELLEWKDLVIDHRQPNTFSVIVDRFIELNNLNLDKIEYFQDGGDTDEIAINELIQKFRVYHRQKANLRIVKKTLNSGRTYQARIKKQNKDLRIK